MATTPDVRNPLAYEPASGRAQRRRIGIAKAVIQALEHELERERSSKPLAQRLAALADRVLAGRTQMLAQLRGGW
ncbi:MULTISPECIES: type II toxin-antitoxin system VapB family antitoxin [Methylobacterium]|uniref:type II toxin-antitoxin system VapB family antitoxin n=1 Tax=Methylobacterium TaxID=407 RepID=UPI00094D6E8E|nr:MULTISPECIES: type II toxin-antitoxin system VapB family antitoxin [Methylobacterium]